MGGTLVYLFCRSMLNIEFYMLQNAKEIHACVSSRTTKQPQKYKSSLALTSASWIHPDAETVHPTRVHHCICDQNQTVLVQDFIIVRLHIDVAAASCEYIMPKSMHTRADTGADSSNCDSEIVMVAF